MHCTHRCTSMRWKAGHAVHATPAGSVQRELTRGLSRGHSTPSRTSRWTLVPKLSVVPV